MGTAAAVATDAVLVETFGDLLRHQDNRLRREVGLSDGGGGAGVTMAETDDDADDVDDGLALDSVVKKRRKKMNKHKLRKRRKRAKRRKRDV